MTVGYVRPNRAKYKCNLPRNGCSVCGSATNGQSGGSAEVVSDDVVIATDNIAAASSGRRKTRADDEDMFVRMFPFCYHVVITKQYGPVYHRIRLYNERSKAGRLLISLPRR